MQIEKSFKEEYVILSGIEHYLLHYQTEPDAPVFLFIHGGPGQSESMMAYVVEEYEKRNYNIVYYDQRGAGKTYLRNKKAKPDTEMLKNDLLEIVLYLKKKYQKEKIGILGDSWGTVLGSMFALEHPEHTLCYIGCGQVVNIMENERRIISSEDEDFTCGQVVNIMENERVGFLKLKEAIENSGNKRDQRKLSKIGEYPVNDFNMNVYRKMGRVRNLQGKYNLAMSFDKSMIKMFIKSPIMGVRDILPFMTGMMVNMQVMKELMSFDLKERGLDYQVPVYYVLGEKDQQTPVEIGVEYFNKIKAPVKKLYMIKNAGHLTMIDNISGYRNAICEIVEQVSLLRAY